MLDDIEYASADFSGQGDLSSIDADADYGTNIDVNIDTNIDLVELDATGKTGRGEPAALTQEELEAISGYGLLSNYSKRGGVAPTRIVSLDELPHDKTGGGSSIYRMDTTSHTVDKTIRAIMPEKITECAIAFEGKSTCSDEILAGKIAEIIKSSARTTEAIIDDAKKATGCATEKCAVEKVISRAASKQRTKAILTRFFKIDGPTNTKLLSNINIDTSMMQFASVKPHFFPHPFNMLDYASNSFIDGEVVNTPDTLARIDWEMLNGGSVELPEPYAGRKFTACGCIINSDTYDGPGKHWMALYADWSVSPASIEFFNSSGNSPAPEFCNWMVKMKIAMENASMKAECTNVSSIRHQHTRSECGVYSLFYIWARLNGTPYTYFQNTPVPDNIMFEFRQHLFSGDAYVNEGAFDFEKFRSGVQIEWEPGHNAKV